MKDIGKRMRILRENAKLSQAKVAEYIGSNQPSIGRYETGFTAPPLDVLVWYANFFGVSMDELFGRENLPKHPSALSATDAGSRYKRPVIIRDIIMESVNSHPDLTAYMYKDARTEPYKHVTYRETADDINALGTQLVEMGLKEKRIAVIGDNCYHWAIAYFAVLFGVGVVVPLDKELRKEEIVNLLKVSECEAIFHTERYDEMLADIDFVPFKIRMNVYAATPNPEGQLTCKGLIEAGKKLSKDKIESFQSTPIDDTAMAALLFTSGTTGNAKGVMLSNRGMGTNIGDMAGAHNAKPGGSTVSILPMHHCFEAVMGQQFMLTNGVAIAFGDGLKYIQKNMQEVKPTIMLFVPLLLENLYRKIMEAAVENGREADLRRRINDYIKLRNELGPEDDSKARLIAREMFKEEQAIFGGRLDSVFTGAATINPTVIQGLQEIGLKITYGYGMTECGPLMTTTPYFSDTMSKPGSVGPATKSGTMRIDKPDAKGIGEICYKGPTVMLGYYNRQKETAESMQGDWLRSGDFGIIDNEGWLYVTGRQANMIVTKTGKNVFPEELEAELVLTPYIDEIMIYASEDKKRGGALISAQIRPDYEAITDSFDAETAADAGKVFDILHKSINEFNAGIANYKRIRHIMIRDEEFVKTPTKKIMRSRNV